MRHAADRNDQSFERYLRGGTRCIRVIDIDAILFDGDPRNRYPRTNVETLLLECLQRFLGNRFIGDAEKGRQRFEHRDFRSEPVPHASHLEADHTRANDAKFLRNLRNRQRAFVVEHAVVVDRNAG